MPGILPMKVIKIGNSAQSRIAQACDRCRSKKIRCDGVRPTCSQCASVGFECRTSDKLSRRAFPRGYTESLEERVRMLEAEVRDLKDILDEKDEKIDILSAIYGGGDLGRASSVTSARLASPSSPKDAPVSIKENTFRAQATQLLFGVENSDSYFMGPSSGRDFIVSLKHKLRESGKPCGDFNPDAFLHIQGCLPLATLASAVPDKPAKPPPRLFSDKCVNVFFQEWAPLFPVLHRPTFLRTYEEFVNDPERVKWDHKSVQLFLVFSIAGLSSPCPDLQQVANCEQQWIKALEPLLIESTMDTLQCLILAVLYCATRADYRRLQLYKSMAVGLCHRLGLHQSQKRFSFGALTLEMRKKVFWSLYTLDCFTAAIMGLPRLLQEEDVQTEYPSDSDDETAAEQGFQPTLADDHTPIAGALALFQASRILARVLEKIYPSSASYDLSLEQMGALERELDTWYNDLPQSLRLNFAQGKPSTDVTGSRSPLMALAYYFIRTLIYRPAVGSSLGSRAAPALMSISESSKHLIQVSQLLEERSMSFSFCLNKGDMLAVCGLTLLYQMEDLWQDSKLRQESGRLVMDSLKTMREIRSPGFEDLDRVARALININVVMIDAAVERRPRKSISPASSCRSLPPTSLSQHVSSPSSESPYQAAADGSAGVAQGQGKARRIAKPHAEFQSQGACHNDKPRHSSDAQHLAAKEMSRMKRSPSSSSSSSSSSLSPTTAQPRATTPAVQAKTVQGKPNLDFLELQISQSHNARPQSSQLYAQSHPHSHGLSHFQSRSRSRSRSYPHPHLHAQSNNASARWSSIAASSPSLSSSLSSTTSSSTAAATSSLSGTRNSVKSEGISGSEWEALLGAMDGGSNNVYNAIYGGTGILTKTTGTGSSKSTTDDGWTRDSWDLSSFSAGDGATEAAPSHSVLSMSDESLSSEEGVTPPELGMGLENVEYQKQVQGFNLEDLFLL